VILMLTLILALTAVLPARADQSPYAWPLDLDTRYLTSNFMETRSGRFHTGIDLKTQERTGLAVLAVDEGWISRIKFGANGYGKALYLTNAEGRTFVYAHLERLADPFRRRVRAAQQAREQYAVDVYPVPGELPVVRGEIIALSGETATNGPHLHFEVRQADGSPLNPLTHGFAVPDTLVPEITAVRVWWGNRSYLHGDGVRSLTGELPPLAVPAGSVQVSARIIERSDHLRYRLEPWSVDLTVDGWGTVGAGACECLRWSDNRRERVVFRETDLGRERAFWIAGAGGGWRADGYHGQGPGTPVDPLGTERVYRLVARDAAGNTSEVWWPVVVSAAAETASPGWTETSAAAVAAQRQEDVLDLSRSVAGEADILDGSGASTGAVSTLIAPLLHPQPTRLSLQGRPTWYLSEHPFPHEHMVERRRVAVAWPDGVAPGDPRLAVYVFDEEDGWERAADLERVGQRWCFGLDQPGAHVLALDAVPPRLSLPAVVIVGEQRPRQRHGIALSRWERLEIAVDDDESGIDWGSARVSVAGRDLIAEPDPPRRRLLVELPDDLEPGEHPLIVLVRDRAGQAVEAVAEVVLTDGG